MKTASGRQGRRQGAAKPAEAKAARASKQSASSSDAPLVLVVDDYEDNRSLYTRFLAYSGMRVAEAADGHEALAKARELHPDVIVMDLRCRASTAGRHAHPEKDPAPRALP